MQRTDHLPGADQPVGQRAGLVRTGIIRGEQTPVALTEHGYCFSAKGVRARLAERNKVKRAEVDWVHWVHWVG